MKPLVEESEFREHVAKHEMTVKHDDGLYRHLRFNAPGSWNRGFDVVTWPGFLAFTGDMGEYLFCRTEDMLEFFRNRSTGPLSISPSYWAEKCEAADRNGEIEEYSADKFRERIKEWLDDLEADGDEVSPELRKAVEDEVLSHADDGEHEAGKAAYEFRHEGFEFSDFWECNLRVYSYRFLWCCYAIAWAVRVYDGSRSEVA